MKQSSSEYYKSLSPEMKVWRSRQLSLGKAIRKLKKKLEPQMIGHFAGRIYTGETQRDLNKLKALEEQKAYHKALRPEKRKPKVINSKRYSSRDVMRSFGKLSNRKKVSVLTLALQMKGRGDGDVTCIIKGMGYVQDGDFWIRGESWFE